MCSGSGDSHHYWPPTSKRKGDYGRSGQSLFFGFESDGLGKRGREKEGEGGTFIEKLSIGTKRGREREREEEERESKREAEIYIAQS